MLSSQPTTQNRTHAKCTQTRSRSSCLLPAATGTAVSRSAGLPATANAQLHFLLASRSVAVFLMSATHEVGIPRTPGRPIALLVARDLRNLGILLHLKPHWKSGLIIGTSHEWCLRRDGRALRWVRRAASRGECSGGSDKAHGDQRQHCARGHESSSTSVVGLMTSDGRTEAPLCTKAPW